VLELATALHDKRVTGPRIAAISNAGYETVGMADNVTGPRHHIEIARLSDDSQRKLAETLAGFKLDKLVNARNPLDLTPMASDEAYEQCVRVMLESPEVDAVVASLVPLTPAMLTTPDEISKPGSLVERLPKLFAEANKPVIVSIDAGAHYDPLVSALREAGVPVFRSADEAVRSLGRYLCQRSPIGVTQVAEADEATRLASPTEAATRDVQPITN